MAIAPERLGIGIRRHFTADGVHPYDEVVWERRDARITNYTDGSVAFEQLGVEVPAGWSLNATNILAQKYFRGAPGSPEREWSLKQVADRVVDTITAWGVKDGYFVDAAEANAFNAELKYLIVNQRAAFNSPVWFNIGVEGRVRQSSACFILSVEDSMTDILNWYVEEGIIFKGGSGAGVNLSRIRSSKERLKGGGTASGPVSFMRGADASAGTIKSGGVTRRAAKMVILDADHPDIEDFIWCKAVEERKARALRAAGFDMDLDGKDSNSLQYQNANNSIRLTDEFMQAVLDDADWHLTAVTTGETLQTLKARHLFRQIAEAAWECADPGVQYDTTINRWHTLHASGRITASNPCFTGDTRVHTDKGLVRFDEMLRRVQAGEWFGVYTHDATNPEAPTERVEISRPEAFMITGRNEIVRLRFDNGAELRCTANHRLWTANRGWVEARALSSEDQVRVIDRPTPAVNADHSFPVSTDAAHYHRKADQAMVRLPEKWTDEFAHYLGWLIGDGCISTAGVAATIYGSEEDRQHILPRHLPLVTELCQGDAPKASVQSNGTVQLRLGRGKAVRFLEALGASSAKAPDKVVPWAVEQAPPAIMASFLRGLFDADGCVYDGATTRYVGLGSASRQLLVGVQRLLSTFGVFSRIYATQREAKDSFTYVRKDGTFAIYESKPMYDLRISNRSVATFAERIGFSLPAKSAKLTGYLNGRVLYNKPFVVKLVERNDDGVELTYNLNEPRNHSYMTDTVLVSNCSEYLSVDDSACNLASLNLLRYLDDQGDFDVEGFKAGVKVMFTAQEILVGMSEYPTAKIGENTRKFRQLGLGYANLGALLMAKGLAYDSDDGRAWAAAITALMTGHAYATSAGTAARMGPFAGYHENAEHMLRVLRMHREAVASIDEERAPTEVLSAAQEAWDEAVETAERYGVRNSQATVLAPTGTISFLLDCDTTGVEPDLGLVKTKKLVGGGTMSIVNQTVPWALRTLGYDEAEVDAIVSHIDRHKTILGAPALKAEHLSVFACSMGDNVIHHYGHIRLMAAVQPFISGALSKCVVGETLVTTADGLVRIGVLHDGEAADSFRSQITEVASLDGTQKTDAFYYGGVRPVREVVVRSGHRVTGTPNHRLLVAGRDGLDWRRLDEVEVGDHVAVMYGAELWSTLPARFDDFRPSPRHGNQKAVVVPSEMTADLALLLGMFASEGHATRSTWTVVITNSVEAVLQRAVGLWRSVFGVDARITRDPGKCPGVVVSSKTIVEFLEYLGCGERASAKRIPDAILLSPREMVLSFLQGLALDAYATVSGMAKWAICVDSPAMLDDFQAVLTNLGIVHGRSTKRNVQYDKCYDEVYVVGPHAAHLADLVPFLEPDKAARAAAIPRASTARHNTADIVPGISPYELYRLIPRAARGTGHLRTPFSYLCDPRTVHVSRHSLERVAAVPGVVLPQWLRTVLDDDLHFSPVDSVRDGGLQEVFDLSVPATQAFVGNGIVNHNTVNLPETATIDEVEELHIEAWKMGIKALAIYRDNCKVAQPLSTTMKDAPLSQAQAHDRELAAKVAELEKALNRQTVVVKQPMRERLPRRRKSATFAFRVADCEGYVTVGEYDDGRPGEVFMKVSKQGSTLAGVMDAFSISVSLGLQHGVPLRTYVQKYTNMRFEPAGMTDDPELRIASSLVDYIFRRLAVDYLTYDERADLGILTSDERSQPTLPGVDEVTTPSAGVVEARPVPAGPPVAMAQRDAPFCFSCGNEMQRAGSCYACGSCGSTSGCS